MADDEPTPLRVPVSMHTGPTHGGQWVDLTASHESVGSGGMRFSDFRDLDGRLIAIPLGASIQFDPI